MSKRLKLYETTIRSYVSRSDSRKFKKIAYKNEMTVSELVRLLIKLIIKLDKMNKLDSKLKLTDNEFNKLINSIGGILN